MEPELWTHSLPLKHMFATNFSEHDCKFTAEGGEQKAWMWPPVRHKRRKLCLALSKREGPFSRGLLSFHQCYKYGNKLWPQANSVMHLSALVIISAADQLQASAGKIYSRNQIIIIIIIYGTKKLK